MSFNNGATAASESTSFNSNHGEGTTCVLFSRHGETTHNVQGILQGQLDTQLTPAGVAQAAALGGAFLARRIPNLAPVVYSSDLARAAETAKRAISVLEPQHGPLQHQMDARLRERRLGPFEGHAEAESRKNHATAWRKFCEGKHVDGVETVAEVHRRASTALREIVAAHAGKTVIVVSHGGVIYTVCEPATHRAMPPLGNCSTTELFFDTPMASPRAGAIGQPPTDRPGSAPERRNVDVQQQQSR